ncbi:DUF4390 domain-containing protein [Rhodoferax sp. AJA081-3]|uniref:DUF4390 domain-containing protein n=1 Tax=Rhodoferax sp. AJA081-3 TaxID=2752316 RepID=UPI002111AA91|nr:DUF4390 domain-containing protein [Rhodoferax sp. AJA081-3]
MRQLCVWAFVWLAGVCQAQIAAEVSQYQVERFEEEVLVSAQVAFDLPPAVEDALLKGIPMFFVTEATVVRERWYWYDKKLVAVQRHMRLAYQPLTRRWRLNVSAGAGREVSVGLALNPSFDTLEEALSAVKRVSRWKIADVADFESGLKYKVNFSFKLDLSQLPRPFQIGALGQSDWDLNAATSTTLTLAPLK